MFGEFSMVVIEKVKEYKKLNIYKCVTVAEITQVLSLANAKDVQIQ